MHPSYKPIMWNRQFYDLYDMMEYAHEVQANLHLDKAYQPSSTPAESVDPSLAYRGPRREERPIEPTTSDSRSRGTVRFADQQARSPSWERRDYSKERAQKFDASSTLKSLRENERP
jgi:hypothetical protein